MSAIAQLAENAHWLVVIKPAGLSSIAERDPAVPNLRALLESTRGERLYVVHRLDKEVSGLLLFARTAEAHRELSIAFEQRRIEKTYLAAVHGRVPNDEGRIDAPIREFGSGRMAVHPRGKASVTRYRVLARGPGHSLLAVSPESGRRHQIRVHLYSLGHSLVGDPRYGDPALAGAASRLMLHASRLVLPALSFHPGEAFEAAPPPDFSEQLARLSLSLPP